MTCHPLFNNETKNHESSQQGILLRFNRKVLFIIGLYDYFKHEIVNNFTTKFMLKRFFIRFYWVFLILSLGIKVIYHDEQSSENGNCR